MRIMFIAILLFLVPTISFATTKHRYCSPIRDVYKTLLTVKKQGYFITMVAHPGVVLQVFSDDKGKWTLLGILPDAKEACVLLYGSDLTLALGRIA